MKVTFIRPNMYAKKASDALQPLVFALLAALTPSDIETVLYDDRIEEIPFDEPTDLVAMTVETFTARRAYHIAAQYQQRGVSVVMGGFHPTLVPQEALQYATAIVIGDAEPVWPHLLSDVRQGMLQRVYRATSMSSPLKVSFNRRIFKGKSYPPLDLIQWGRGCRHHCDFCSIHAVYGPHLYHRPVDDVIAEIEGLNSKFLFFVDDNLFVNKYQLITLLEALTALKIHWSCQISLDVAQDDKLLTLLEKSGCQAVLIGFESFHPHNLRQMHKQWNLRQQDYPTAIEKLYAHGMMIYGMFVFGYDEDTNDSFAQCLDFALHQKFFIANFNPLTPFPGTPLYARLKHEGRLLADPWWLHETYQYGHAIFHPRKMTADELTEGCFRVRKAFNTYTSILNRALNFHVNLRTWQHALLYVVANYINRKEVYNKQGGRLGQ
jgi:radical SAM superfamily enzyme YgiQ (UPF0313 family)